MQVPNFFHIGAVRGIHLTHTCANPGTIEMPAAIHTWARWALGQKFRPDLIGFIVAQGQPTIECRDSLYVAPVLDRRLPIARASRTRSSSRLVPLIHQAFGVRLATDYLAFSVAFHEADPEKILVEGATVPLLDSDDPRNHYALMFALAAFLRRRTLRAGWIKNLQPVLNRVHLEFACLLCITLDDTPSFRAIVASRRLDLFKRRVVIYLCAAEPVRREHASAMLPDWRRQAETATRQVRRLSAYVAAAALPAAA
jgi:hypothetical protein